MESPTSKLSLRTNASPTDLSTTGKLSLCTEKTLSSPTQTSRDHKIAISVLQKSSTDTGESVYDHLVDIIKKIIVERPKNVVDNFEDFSRRIRQDRYRSDERTQRGFYQTNYRMDVSAEILAGLVLNTEPLFLTNSFMNKWMKRLHYWSSAGIGFSHDKQIQLTLSMQRLLTNSIVQDVRFWGTVYGIEKNHYIAEATLTKAENESRVSLVEDTLLEMELRETQTSLKSSIIGETPSNAELRTKIQEVIKSQHTPPDLNDHVYFVCHDFHSEWIELPSVTPEEIVQSRIIKKYCRGNLEATVVSSPPFPGTEKHYLRALIARISHGTYVSPIHEKADEPLDNLIHAASWKHAQAEINDDGTIGNSIATGDGSKESELSISEKNSMNESDDVNGQIETEKTNDGPSRAAIDVLEQRRLSALNESDIEATDDVNDDSKSASTVQSETVWRTCADDYFDDRIRAWSIALVDNYCIPDAIIVANSAIWNGSFTLATHGHIDHIYFGWGQKMTMKPVVPFIHLSIEDEYAMPDLECKQPKYE